MKLPVHNLKCTCLLSLSFWFLCLQSHGNSLNPQLHHIFNSLKEVEDSTVQASMLRGTLAGLSGKRDLVAPASWKALRNKLVRSKDPEVVKLAGQLSQIFGDLSVSQDALKLVLNRRCESRWPKGSPFRLGGDAIPGASEKPEIIAWDAFEEWTRFGPILFSITQKLLKELISEYDQFDTVAKRATIETLASKQSYAKALLEALRTGKICQSGDSELHRTKFTKYAGWFLR